MLSNGISWAFFALVEVLKFRNQIRYYFSTRLVLWQRAVGSFLFHSGGFIDSHIMHCNSHEVPSSRGHHRAVQPLTTELSLEYFPTQVEKPLCTTASHWHSPFSVLVHWPPLWICRPRADHGRVQRSVGGLRSSPYQHTLRFVYSVVYVELSMLE